MDRIAPVGGGLVNANSLPDSQYRQSDRRHEHIGCRSRQRHERSCISPAQAAGRYRHHSPGDSRHQQQNKRHPPHVNGRVEGHVSGFDWRAVAKPDRNNSMSQLVYAHAQHHRDANGEEILRIGRELFDKHEIAIIPVMASPCAIASASPTIGQT
jgi:hypothetical protein